MPREGHDYLLHDVCHTPETISIHVPREGHDSSDIGINVKASLFQSTCPARGTTAVLQLALERCTDFNPRAPRGARHSADEQVQRIPLISIHVPREGHDRNKRLIKISPETFQSTCPARGTTTSELTVSGFNPFQSTCPARGTTTRCAAKMLPLTYFNPRAPRGARLHFRLYADPVQP